jgi:hypothetical protein
VDGTEELINGFEWITRAEARTLASENGYLNLRTADAGPSTSTV